MLELSKKEDKDMVIDPVMEENLKRMDDYYDGHVMERKRARDVVKK